MITEDNELVVSSLLGTAAGVIREAGATGLSVMAEALNDTVGGADSLAQNQVRQELKNVKYF